LDKIAGSIRLAAEGSGGLRRTRRFAQQCREAVMADFRFRIVRRHLARKLGDRSAVDSWGHLRSLTSKVTQQIPVVAPSHLWCGEAEHARTPRCSTNSAILGAFCATISSLTRPLSLTNPRMALTRPWALLFNLFEVSNHASSCDNRTWNSWVLVLRASLPRDGADVENVGAGSGRAVFWAMLSVTVIFDVETAGGRLGKIGNFVG